MDELVSASNAAGRVFVDFAGGMLIQSSLLIIILAFLDLALRKRVKAVVRHWIWPRGLTVVVAAALVLLPAEDTSATPPGAVQKATEGSAGAEAVPGPRELLNRYQKAVTAWDRSVAMHIECDYSMAHQGRDFRHWKYDIQHRRDGGRRESSRLTSANTP